MTGAFEWGSLTAMSLPDLMEVPRTKLRKSVPVVNKLQRISRVSTAKNQSSLSQASLLSRIGIFRDLLYEFEIYQ